VGEQVRHGIGENIEMRCPGFQDELVSPLVYPAGAKNDRALGAQKFKASGAELD
jgi:hypothetical protein